MLTPFARFRRLLTAFLVLFLLCFAAILTARSCAFLPGESMTSCPDPAMFYMEGKAWAHGYVPYVDFVDTKGPLLLFIYLIGYLLTPGEPDGLFLIHVLAAMCTVCFLFKTTGIFIRSSLLRCFAVVLTLQYLYDISVLESGAQAEMLMLPFIAALLYYVTLLTYKSEMAEGYMAKVAFFIGFGGAACFLIKFNESIPFILAAAYLLVYCRGRRLKILLWGGSGALLIIAPFLIYMYGEGNLRAFFDIYFLTTITTVLGSHNSSCPVSALSSIKEIFHDWYAFISPLFSASVLSILCLFHKRYALRENRNSGIPYWLVIILSSLFICSFGKYSYYQIPSRLLIIYALMLIFSYLPCSDFRSKALIAFFIIAFSFNLIITSSTNRNTRKNAINPEVKSKIEGLLSEKKETKVLYYGFLDGGFGMANALPACPVWCTLNSMPENMISIQQNAIRERKADFVFRAIIPEEWKKNGNYDAFNKEILEQSGYEYIMDIINERPCSYELWQLNCKE